VSNAGGRGDSISLVEELRRRSELSGEYKQAGVVAESHGKGVRAPVSRAIRTPRLASSCQASSSHSSGRHPGEAHLAPDEAMITEQRLQHSQRSPQGRHTCRVALGKPRNEAVQEEIESP